MSSPLGFLASSTQLATKNPKFRTEIEPECGNPPIFFGLHPNLGAKFWTEIKVSLTQFRKNISPPRNLLNQQKNGRLWWPLLLFDQIFGRRSVVFGFFFRVLAVMLATFLLVNAH